jgi:nucleoside-diphosphate-sugar epimerase
MSRTLAIGAPGSIGRRVILRLLAGGRECYAMVESPTRAAEVRPMLGTRGVRQDRLSFMAADRDDDAARLDAVAGCEYVDDRIRL